MWEAQPDEWARVIAVNLGGTFNTIRLLAPGMIARRSGRIVTPGRINTPMVRAVGTAINTEMIAATPMGRLGEPEDVADCVASLCSPDSSFVTGQICDVAGGWLMS